MQKETVKIGCLNMFDLLFALFCFALAKLMSRLNPAKAIIFLLYFFYLSQWPKLHKERGL